MKFLTTTITNSHLLARATMLAVLLAPAAARAGRPMTADDATVLEPRTCQLEAWWQRLHDHSETWLAPACSIAPGWEAGLSLVRTRAPGSATSERLGGMYAKTVLRPVQTNGWGLGMVVAHLPLAAGSLAGDTSLNVPLTVSLRDDAVLVHANAGWTRHHAIRQGGATWALGAEMAVTPRAALTLETFGAKRGHSYVQAGARYSVLPSRLDIDAAYGERLTARGKEGYLSLGLTFVASLAH
jgi:alpha-D-ribose 1-methylphosphonate 5-triphosphate synthase subunit PhnG